MKTGLVYHGRTTKSSEFSFDYVGGGNDNEGPGFYFTSDPTDAWYNYAKNNGILISAYLTLDKVVSTTKKPSEKVVRYLITHAPNLEDTLINWDENRRVAIENAVGSMMSYDTEHTAYQSVWYDFYYMGENNSKSYLLNMIKLGFDGIIIQKSQGVAHYIMFNPSSIDIVKAEPYNYKINPLHETVTSFISRFPDSTGIIDACIDGYNIIKAPRV